MGGPTNHLHIIKDSRAHMIFPKTTFIFEPSYSITACILNISRSELTGQAMPKSYRAHDFRRVQELIKICVFHGKATIFLTIKKELFHMPYFVMVKRKLKCAQLLSLYLS